MLVWIRFGYDPHRFTEAVSIKSICISGGEDGKHPKVVKLYVLAAAFCPCSDSGALTVLNHAR